MMDQSNNMDNAIPSPARSRHISLQARVDSIAEAQELRRARLSDANIGKQTERISDMPKTFALPVHDRRSQSRLTDDAFEYNRKPESKQSVLRDLDAIATVQAAEMSSLHEITFIITVALSHFCTQYGLGMTLTSLDIIPLSFETTNPHYQSWTMAGYTLTAGTFIMIAGRLGDIFGHKRMLAFGYAWFSIWSGFGGFAVYPRDNIFFDICRAFQGIGAALIMPNGLALFGRVYRPGIKKNLVFSIFGALGPAGFVAGAALGGLFAQKLWWPWAFWSFACVLWVLAIFTPIVVPEEVCEQRVKALGFDWAGSFMSVAGLVLVDVAWNNAPLYGWAAEHVYVLLILGFLCLAAFVWIERNARHPILPLKAMTGIVNCTLTSVAFGWGAFGAWGFYSFRFLQQVRHCSPLSMAAQFSPVVLCSFLATGLTGFMLTHTPVSFVMLVAMTGFAISIVLTATMPATQTFWAQMFVSVLIMPIGMTMSLPAATIIASNHMPLEHQGIAMSLVNSVAYYSMSISLGIAGTVESNVAQTTVLPADVLQGIRAALYLGVGLAAAGMICSALILLHDMVKKGWTVSGASHFRRPTASSTS